MWWKDHLLLLLSLDSHDTHPWLQSLPSKSHNNTGHEWIASGLAGRTPRQSPLLWSSPTVALRHHSLRAVAAVDTWIDFGSPAETNNCASAIYITHLKLRFPPYIIVYLNLPENMVPLNPILNHHVHSFSPFILPFAGDTWWYGIPNVYPICTPVSWVSICSRGTSVVFLPCRALITELLALGILRLCARSTASWDVGCRLGDYLLPKDTQKSMKQNKAYYAYLIIKYHKSSYYIQ